MVKLFGGLLGLAMGLGLCPMAQAADGVRTMEVADLPAGGLLLVPVPEALDGAGVLRVTLDGVDVLAQEIVGAGTCVVRATPEQVAQSRQRTLALGLARGTEKGPAGTPVPRVDVETAAFTLTFERGRNGALPGRVRWTASGKETSLAWKDRVYATGNDQGLAGTWLLAQDPDAQLWDFGRGPLFRQVRTSGGFVGGGRRSAADPRATYEWVFLNDSPEWVYLVMSTRQDNPGIWEQHWTGVVHVPYGTFPRFAADAAQVVLDAVPAADSGKAPVRPVGRTFSALVDGADFMAAYSPNNCAYFDPKVKTAYLHSTETVSRQEWPGTPDRRAVFYRWGTAADPAAALATPPPMGRPGLVRRLDLAAAAERVRPGETVSVARVANLAVGVGILDGTRAEVKYVKVEGRTVATGPQPLMEVVTEEVATGRRLRFDSTMAWREVTVGPDGRTWRFRGPVGHPALAEMSVTVVVAPGDDGASAAWTWRGTSGNRAYALVEATVGALSLDGTAGMRAFYPYVMGRVERAPCSAEVNHRGNYPAMHCAMQWEAVWDERSGRCFYVGAHDSHTGAKFIGMRGLPDRSAVRLELTHRLAWDGADPAAESVLPGAVVWKAMPGDWYDAALFYRDWARAHSRSYPAMGPKGRVSTPDWFKRLGFIVRTHGFAQQATNDVRTALDYLGVPVMAQWYQWHQIPFDNDYPHYFPAKPGFEDGIRQIHDWGAKIVPYTNGHIWDTRDRGCEDWKFSREGAAGACRRRDGSLYTEHYRTVETNGQKVTFAAMCPASRVWRGKVAENGDKVMNVSGCDGYYMDQVGAFSTIDCRNAAHGHPFGGGHWWQDAYRTLLTDVRAQARKPVFLATEANAEHTIGQIDAFVCWNILGGIDTVPAFEVVYATAAFPYCRSYVTGPAGRRQMRMKFANVLADGELFGWFPASFCRDPALGPYLRACVRFRWHNAPWFYRAEMRRPPVLLDDVPMWSEAWNVFGKDYPVTMPVVQTGARLELEYDYASDGTRLWKTGHPKRAFVYFTNFSDGETARTRVRFDWKDLGVDPSTARFTRVDAEGRRTPFSRAELEGPLSFAPGTCWGVEIEPPQGVPGGGRGTYRLTPTTRRDATGGSQFVATTAGTWLGPVVGADVPGGPPPARDVRQSDLVREVGWARGTRAPTMTSPAPRISYGVRSPNSSLNASTCQYESAFIRRSLIT